MRPVVFLLPAVLFALPQRPAQEPPPAALVSLNVVALDSKGQSLTDLTAADFRVFDNGKPQNIVSFRRRDTRPAPAALLGPRQYSNRSLNGIPHATVILFDLLNMQFSDRGYVLNQLNHSLQQFEAADSLYLYLITTSGSLYAVHGLPENGEQPAAQTASWTKDIQATLNEAMRVTLARRPIDIANDVDLRVRTTFATLSVVAARLAAVPGRKTIVWLTHGVPISLGPNRTVDGSTIDYTPYVRQLSNTLDRSDVSLYAVQQSPPGSINNSGSAETGRTAPGADPNTPLAGMGSEDTLSEFANLTGGRAYENNDIAGAIKQAINDAKQSYLLSYAPPPENWDGKYHKIRLTCTRKGVRLQSRQGYLAFADQGASVKQAKDAIEAATLSPLDAAEIGLRLAATPLPGEAAALHLAATIDLADVQLTHAGDLWTGNLESRFIEYQDDGTMRQTKPTSLALRLTAEQYNAAMKEGLPVNENLSIAPHTRNIRLIVFDTASSALGSLTIPASR